MEKPDDIIGKVKEMFGMKEEPEAAPVVEEEPAADEPAAEEEAPTVEA